MKVDLENFKENIISKKPQILNFFEILPEGIIPINKSIPPFMKFEEGFGYQGVLLLDSEKDKIQCHFCGKWFKSLVPHLKFHKTSGKEYRDKVGLFRKSSLISLGTRQKFQVANNLKKTENIPELSRERVKKTHITREILNGSKTMQYKNKYGTCEAQLKFRLEEAIKRYGRIPTTSEERTLYHIFEKRFGTWIKGLNHFGFEIK